MTKTTTTRVPKEKRVPKDQRYREKCFPGGETEVLAPKKGGFAPLPYISRFLLSHMKGAEVKVWAYLLTRGGPYSICYPTYEDMMAGTGTATKGTISKAIKRLEKIGLIRVYNDHGIRRYLLRDARLSVQRLYELGEIDTHSLEDANDLLDLIGQPTIPLKRTGSQSTFKKATKGGVK